MGSHYQRALQDLPAVGHRKEDSIRIGDADGSSSSNQTRAATLVYPNGRTISYDYGSLGGIDDVISRIENIKESSSTYASYSYLGTRGVGMLLVWGCWRGRLGRG